MSSFPQPTVAPERSYINAPETPLSNYGCVRKHRRDSTARTVLTQRVRRPSWPSVAAVSRVGDSTPEGLEYADPTEQLDLVEPPEASSQGCAKIELPLGIPPGRGGVQHDLTLRYDSGGGNGWLGTGWDLNVGEVSVATRWGVAPPPVRRRERDDLLDGEMLSPTAIRSEPESPRVVDRRLHPPGRCAGSTSTHAHRWRPQQTEERLQAGRSDHGDEHPPADGMGTACWRPLIR